MREIAVCGMFRDSVTWHGYPINQVNLFFDRLLEQERDANVRLTYFLLEGDSRDETRAHLEKRSAELNGRVTIISHNVGGRPPASIATQDRFLALSEVGNACLRPAVASGAGHIFWMESDLVPDPGLLKGLLEITRNPIVWNNTLGVAPLAVIEPGGQRLFYDTWAFEGENGEKWDNFSLAALASYPRRYRPMRAVGSCVLLNGQALRKHNLDFGTGCFPALCRSGREVGLDVYCDTTLEVKHPCNVFLENRWV